MTWLDRDRTPALFAIGTSVVSGLISLAIGKFMTDAPRNVLVVWVVAVVGTVVLVVLAGIQVIRRARKRARRVFLIVSAFDQKYYVAEFVRQLTNALDRANIDLVLKVPDRDSDASAQAHLLERVLERKHDYMGGVIFAGEVDILRDDLAMFCRKSRLPVVFTDLEPFPEDEYPENSVYVGYDTAELGRQAGWWLVNHLRGFRRPRVLIIASREHASRQEECARILRAELKGVEVVIDDTCDFMRSRARDAVLRHVKNLRPQQCLHAIFCTDDEMGLGVLEALKTPSPLTASTVVIGIDGVVEARSLIDSGTSPFTASVVQNTHQLALGILDSLVKMHRGRPLPKRRVLKASIYETGR
ncbi:sugar ABC transporter substrate-binding protein [Actinophytocola sp. KF-1]